MKIDSENIIFLHPGKTGGTSIEHSLKDMYLRGYKFNSNQPDFKVMFGYDPSRHFFLQHANLSTYKELSIDYKNYKTIVSVRRPYERILSCFFYNAKDKKYTFKKFVEQNLERIANLNIINHFTRQSSYFSIDGYNVNNIIRLENISEDSKRIGINVKYHYSKTIACEGMSDRISMYDKKTKDIVYEIYKEDFLLFDYKR